MTNAADKYFNLGVSFRLIEFNESLEVLSILRDSSVKAVELYEPVFNAGNAPRDELAQVFADAGVVARVVHAAFGNHLDLSAPDIAIRSSGIDAVSKAVKLARRTGARMVVIHASGEPITELRHERMRYARESLGLIIEQACELGCRIAVELLPRTNLGRTVDELFELIDGFDSRTVGLCLDTNHLMTDYRQLPDVVRAIGPHLIALHCSDYDGVDEKHWPPLKGVIDWPAFLDALHDIHFTGPINYEAHLEGDTPAQRLCFLESNFTCLMKVWRQTL